MRISKDIFNNPENIWSERFRYMFFTGNGDEVVNMYSNRRISDKKIIETIAQHWQGSILPINVFIHGSFDWGDHVVLEDWTMDVWACSIVVSKGKINDLDYRKVG
jgi:hypothetical protein